ncbi:hypothetical protein [Cupriavidus sp. H18C2]|uniref:hypothetical protein n=1 Tax=Cupriavidus sp. H18C2 TaxID=3241602 RepID=UPI003BF8F1E8
MSDGPYRSLPMRNVWKMVAKRGEELAYNSDEVAEATKRAVVSDWKNEVSHALIKALKNVFCLRENSLALPEVALEQLESARVKAGGSVFGMNAVEWSIQLVHEGKFGMAGFLEAIGLAAKARCFANARSIDEHYIREASERKASDVREKLAGAISALKPQELGSILANPRVPVLRKKDAIDEGVPL